MFRRGSQLVGAQSGAGDRGPGPIVPVKTTPRAPRGSHGASLRALEVTANHQTPSRQAGRRAASVFGEGAAKLRSD